jgi:hypothetical protein
LSTFRSANRLCRPTGGGRRTDRVSLCARSTLWRPVHANGYRACQAIREHAELVAYQRPAPIVARGDQTIWPGVRIRDRGEHALTPTIPGHSISHVAVASAQIYELWLGGFARGFDVSVDGRDVGRVKDELSISTTTFTSPTSSCLQASIPLRSPTPPDLTPGSGEDELTSLSAIALEQRPSPASELVSVSPRQTEQLCGRPEVVRDLVEL